MNAQRRVPGSEWNPETDRCLVMGILNVTPDSFSDGGRYSTSEDAVRGGLALFDEGADIIDVGGESTRPGAHRVDAAEEQDRVLPVVRELADAGVPVCVDTMRAATAEAAVGAGACLVNDVSGGLADPAMYPTVAALGTRYIVMHWRAHSTAMHDWATYSDDVTGDVIRELRQRVDGAVAAGIAPERIIIDPGLGFAKESAHNWALLPELPRLIGSGFPVLVGASRKRFLGELLASHGEPRPVGQRDAATTAVSALAAAAGVWGVRVHDVAASADAVRVARAWSRR